LYHIILPNSNVKSASSPSHVWWQEVVIISALKWLLLISLNFPISFLKASTKENKAKKKDVYMSYAHKIKIQSKSEEAINAKYDFKISVFQDSIRIFDLKMENST